MSMFPSLFRLCSAQHVSLLRAPLLSLSTFNPIAKSPALPVGQRRWHARRRSEAVAAKAGKRNIFLDPPEVSNSSVAEVYELGRFNDDDEEVRKEEPPVEDTAWASSPLLLRQAKQIKVKSAEFTKSSVSVKECPKTGFPEFAVIGRSNVGKSSLVNLLTGRKSLALVSKTPGKTRCINHFLINNNWYLVDLPGYGYAQTSKSSVLNWNKFTREYFTDRETLVAVLLLVDASIPPMPLDVACANWFGDGKIPFSLVFTKADKRKKGLPSADENIEAFKQELLKNWEELPPILRTSSKSGNGKGELLAHIAQLRDAWIQESRNEAARRRVGVIL